ncbi:hypothetical protein [Amycolatopsis suaedae]|uniref:Uncharacterized protein n=1 Tax=Amycolatopsis suaedae TaxID=2510978 RepID=A0A4Q7J981_9PSEU|nr:hypothetical protein [Amycolatopsis suaedae]RZQ64310.1 hypothetical protein EWH70_10055 [Amycolatopsis suaedae]
MTDESGDQRKSQKTVAELLAQHGQTQGGGRRRRRRADDDETPEGGRKPGISDTAPQAIIDRVTADTPPPPNRRNGAPGRQQESGAYRRPQPESGGYPLPGTDTGGYPVPGTDTGGYPRPPQQSGAFPQPTQPPQRSGAFPRPPQESGGFQRPAAPPERRQPPRRPAPPPPEPTGLSSRLDGDVDEAPEAPPMGSGYHQAPPPAPPAPPRRRPLGRRPAPKVEPHTEQIPVVEDEPDLAAEEPPAGLADWRHRREQARLEETQASMPALDDDAPAGIDRSALDGGPPTGAYPAPAPYDTGQFGGYQETSGRFSTGDFEAVQRPVAGDLGQQQDDYDADYADEDYVDDPYDEPDDLPEPEYEEEQASAGKQWLAMAGQLALGVAGGAAVWLGFNWLWGQLSVAALIAAVLVIGALVWIVRKIRGADDLQTTVLAVLVGLVVTVSPAALLLLSK